MTTVNFALINLVMISKILVWVIVQRIIIIGFVLAVKTILRKCFNGYSKTYKIVIRMWANTVEKVIGTAYLK